jgi:hypothetical protein
MVSVLDGNILARPSSNLFSYGGADEDDGGGDAVSMAMLSQPVTYL